MISFITILYVLAIVLVFKVFRVRPRPWRIALFVTVGVLMIGGIVVFWTLAAPISQRAVVSRYVVEIVPWVKGKVLSITAKPNVPLKKDSVLFQIDPAPFQDAVNQALGQLNLTESNVRELQAAIQVAKASIAKATADVAATKFHYEEDVVLQKQNLGAVSQLKFEQDKENYVSAQASLQQATASQVQANMALQAGKDAVTSAKAELASAKFNLSQCTVPAPCDGFVTDWQIREGSMANPVSVAAVGTFIDTSETFIVASFPAEELIHVRPGQDVELAFKSRPGYLFHGKVEDIIEATGEGQFTPGGSRLRNACHGCHLYRLGKAFCDDQQGGDSHAEVALLPALAAEDVMKDSQTCRTISRQSSRC
ncbi:MAG: efflux RND transporter periplasmic adaptor subunit [Thermoguttaceae bacterium]